MRIWPDSTAKCLSTNISWKSHRPTLMATFLNIRLRSFFDTEIYKSIRSAVDVYVVSILHIYFMSIISCCRHANGNLTCKMAFLVCTFFMSTVCYVARVRMMFVVLFVYCCLCCGKPMVSLRYTYLLHMSCGEDLWIPISGVLLFLDNFFSAKC